MKRHTSLIPLSSHHQNALFLAKKLKSTKADSSREDRIRLAEDLIDFWNRDGREHFRAEEEVVLPIWAAHTDIWSPEVERMLREHLAIRSRIDSIGTGLERGEAPEWEVLAELGATLDGHVRLEEHDIFERVQKALPEEELSRMEKLLRAR